MSEQEIGIDIAKDKDVMVEITKLYAPNGEVIDEEIKVVNIAKLSERIDNALNYIETLDPSEDLYEIERILKGETYEKSNNQI